MDIGFIVISGLQPTDRTLVAKIVGTPSFFSSVTTVAANLSTYLMSFSCCFVAIYVTNRVSSNLFIYYIWCHVLKGTHVRV